MNVLMSGMRSFLAKNWSPLKIVTMGDEAGVTFVHQLMGEELPMALHRI
jgi:hypothetical protein